MEIRSKERVLEDLRQDADAKELNEIRELWKKHSQCEDRRDVDGILSTLSVDCVYEFVNTEYRWEGKDGARKFYQALLGAVPDAKFELQRIVIGAQGVYEEAIFSGLHKNDFLKYRATGKPLKTVVGILFPWDEKARAFSGERIYADLHGLFEN